MRKLITADAFAVARFIKSTNLKEELKPILELAKSAIDEKSIENVGIEAILTVIHAVGEKKAEKAFYELISGPLEITPAQVEKMELTEMIDTLFKLIKDNDIKSFFNIAGRLNLK